MIADRTWAIAGVAAWVLIGTVFGVLYIPVLLLWAIAPPLMLIFAFIDDDARNPWWFRLICLIVGIAWCLTIKRWARWYDGFGSGRGT